LSLQYYANSAVSNIVTFALPDVKSITDLPPIISPPFKLVSPVFRPAPFSVPVAVRLLWLLDLEQVGCNLLCPAVNVKVDVKTSYDLSVSMLRQRGLLDAGKRQVDSAC